MYNSKKLKFGVSGIYRITNIETGQAYYGSAKCLRKRFNDHTNKLVKNKHPNQYLQNVYNKYGFDVFRAELVELVPNPNQLTEVEQTYLDKFFDKQQRCYNICPIAGSALGRKHTEETKRKISQAHKGKKFSEKTKKKISKAKKKQKHLHFKTGKDNPMWEIGKNHHMYGKKHSEESKKKMSQSSKGKPNLKLAKKIAKYDLQGNCVAVYMSASEAQRVTGIHGIRACAIKNRKSAGGYMWSYDIHKKLAPYNPIKKRTKCSEVTKKKISNTKRNKNKTLLQINKTTHQVIATYQTIAEAEKVTGISNTNISSCCNGNRKTAGGFVWKYIQSN